MNPSNGEIWLVNLNPVKRDNEMGKIRPAVIFQNDILNQSSYPTTIIIPLSTDLIDDAKPIRMRISKRELLKKDSDIVLTQIRSIDKARLIQKIATLDAQEKRILKKLMEELQKLMEQFDEKKFNELSKDATNNALSSRTQARRDFFNTQSKDYNTYSTISFISALVFYSWNVIDATIVKQNNLYVKFESNAIENKLVLSYKFNFHY